MPVELTSKAVSCIHFTMNAGCKFGFVPYSWNSNQKCLEKSKKYKLVVFYYFGLYSGWTGVYMFFQLFRLDKIDIEVPPRIRIMTIIWGLAFSLIFICKIQFHTKKNEIMAFANALLGSIRVKQGVTILDNNSVNRKTTIVKKDNKHKMRKLQSLDLSKINWISLTIYFSTFLLIVNPPAHALVLFDMPCAPQYISALIFPCGWIGDNPVGIIEIIPFVFWENFAFMDMMCICAFYWSLIFLGLLWIKQEIDGDKNTQEESQSNDPLRIALPYRKSQLMTVLVNDAFNLYLQYFPSLLYVIAGTLLFATIRFTHLPFHVFIVFPACSFRCLFEATTQLEAAASLNLASLDYLDHLGRVISRSQEKHRQVEGSMLTRFLVAFKRSCWKLQCSAGSLYTFEKTIVLVSLDHCTQLVFNLLVAFPEAEEQNWGNTVN